MNLFSKSLAFLAAATPAGGGGTPALIQRTTVGRGTYSNAVTSSITATAGNALIIFGAGGPDGSAPVVTTSQGDTVVLNLATVGGSSYRSALGYVASAVGGATAFTLSGPDHSSIYVEEWENIAYDATAGVGTVSGATPQTVTTPGSSTVANSVTFTVMTAWTGTSFAAQTAPSGFTEGARYTGGPSFAAHGQVIGAYRVETATGAKSATWPDDSGSTDFIGAQIMVFSAV